MRNYKMKKIFDFKCQVCETVFEEYTEYKQTTTCECGGTADKIISTPHFYLEGITGSFPGAAIAWEKRHRPIAKKE